MSDAVTVVVDAPDTPETPFAASFNAAILLLSTWAIVVVVTLFTALDVILVESASIAI